MIIFCQQHPFAGLTIKASPVRFCVGNTAPLLQVDTVCEGEIKSFYTRNTNRVQLIFKDSRELKEAVHKDSKSDP